MATDLDLERLNAAAMRTQPPSLTAGPGYQEPAQWIDAAAERQRWNKERLLAQGALDIEGMNEDMKAAQNPWERMAMALSKGVDVATNLGDWRNAMGINQPTGKRARAGKSGGRSVRKIPTRPMLSGQVREAFPGIYDRPDAIARSAEAQVAPESPLLKQLFGVTRDDLYQLSQRSGNRPGTIPGVAKNPKGSEAASAVMTPQNTRRMLDALAETKIGAPELWKGMHAWYAMDPEYQRMVQLMGPEKGAEMYHRLNTFGGIESPNMPVAGEFGRASAANWLAEQGRFHDWEKFGGLTAAQKAKMAPADMAGVHGRVGHVRAAASQKKFLRTGKHGMDSPKAPPYIEASSVPDLGFQTDLPIGDAHWSRAIGLADVRNSKDFGASVSTPEITQLAPWWRDHVAGAAGIESVPAQAITWGAFAPKTGVKTAIGAPKLELHAIEIQKAAKRLGVSPETARDLILMGKTYAGK